MLKEIEQLTRLLESNQVNACLSYIEKLEKDHPNCACLIEAKLTLYRSENRWGDVLQLAETFHTQETENPTAAAEYSVALAMNGQYKQALSILVDAFERSAGDSIHSRLLYAALQVGTCLIFEGPEKSIVPAIAIGHVLKEVPAIADKANQYLFRASSETKVPLILRDWSFTYDCPEGFSQADVFEEVIVLVRLMRWKQALTLLKTLLPHADSFPMIWHNIATLHFWLLNEKEGCQALEHYMALQNLPLEDAGDAETLRLLYSDDPFGDQTETVGIHYTVTDAENVLEKLLSQRTIYHISVPLQAFSPAPKGFFMILDRPFLEEETELTLENVPLEQGVVFLYGKETDREARIEVFLKAAEYQESFEVVIRNILGDLIQFPGTIANRLPTSKTRQLAESPIFVPGKGPIQNETTKRLYAEYFVQSFPEKWFSQPLGLLDGKTPSEAAKEPAYTIRLLAAIQLIELSVPPIHGIDVAQHLRSLLKLPTLETITVTEDSQRDPLEVLDAYPVWRWYRFDVSKLSTEILASGLQIVAGMGEMRAMVRFAEEILARPMNSMDFSIRILAFESILSAMQAGEKFKDAFLWLDRARNESVAQNVPDAAWYLHEISLSLMTQDMSRAWAAIEYVYRNYGDDPKVMQALQELLIRLGLLSPDGSFAPGVQQRLEALSRIPEESPQALWTPDMVGHQNATGSKLWVPD